MRWKETSLLAQFLIVPMAREEYRLLHCRDQPTLSTNLKSRNGWRIKKKI
jgi:hypothetical protein